MGPFEAAVRDAAEMRMQHMQDAMQRMGKTRMEGMDHSGHMDDMDMGEGGRGSPLDRLDAVASRLTEVGAALKKVAELGQAALCEPRRPAETHFRLPCA